MSPPSALAKWSSTDIATLISSSSLSVATGAEAATTTTAAVLGDVNAAGGDATRAALTTGGDVGAGDDGCSVTTGVAGAGGGDDGEIGAGETGADNIAPVVVVMALRAVVGFVRDVGDFLLPNIVM